MESSCECGNEPSGGLSPSAQIHIVSYVHLPEYRPQPFVSLAHKDNTKFMSCCVLSGNLP
jgi:hypothetical protein